jgi:hypothetical protein
MPRSSAFPPFLPLTAWRMCKQATLFECNTLGLEVIHDKIPNSSMASQKFDDLLDDFENFLAKI